MRFQDYNFRELEPQMLEYWAQHDIVGQLRKKNAGKPKFYFLEGPPYTSGRIHLGTAWNMVLKDLVLRYKRMQGMNVWDRMGYDMHGLPTEQKVMAKLQLKDKADIERFGVKKFQQECLKFCQEMMEKMNVDFVRLGATLDFSNPYQPIKKEFMDAEWWLIRQVHKQGRLYQGLRTMHWDAAAQSAVAKHELEYKQVTDISIYVKFHHKSRENTYFIVWTTTPWTIPLNLAVMVNPDLEYADVLIGKEIWIMASSLVSEVMKKAGVEQYSIQKQYLGKELEHQHYIHPLGLEPYLPEELRNNRRLFSVLLTREYVDASTGTGLVHCAPGCGPEDYEVGHLYHLPPFNCVNEQGVFENFGPFNGWKAKTDDGKFTAALQECSAIVAKEPYVHDYPHGERTHEPVIFRTTKQWFFKVEDLKEKIVAANETIYWYPESGKNAFRSWLENLRDNSITKQRFWGTPVPIWLCEETGKYIVVGSLAELEKLSGKKVPEMHIPDLDEITITRRGKVYRRIPDVLDVWIDAGTVSWNCLDYPQNKKLFPRLFPADFILEGKDQIRGWFNLLMVASFLAFEKPSFKNVYMHGFITDVEGVKMSKSLGNVISPDDLIEKHGVDVLRYYLIGTTAGEDLNFSWEEAGLKGRNLIIIWNIHKLLISLAKENQYNPFAISAAKMKKHFRTEEKYILSLLHSTIQKVTALLQAYKLDEAVAPLEELFLELSRTYVQFVRDKISLGSEAEKEACLHALSTVFLETLKMFSAIAPFISEAMYLNLKEEFNLPAESISHYPWPKADSRKIDATLEMEMRLAKQIIQAAASAREKAKLGLRWSVKEVVIVSNNPEVSSVVKDLKNILKRQINCKEIHSRNTLPGMAVQIKPNPGKIGPAFGKSSPVVISKILAEKPEAILQQLEEKGHYTIMLGQQEVHLTSEMVEIIRTVPAPYVEGEFKQGMVYLNNERTPELEAEGYAREVMRQVQQLRKNAGMQKWEYIYLYVKVTEEMKLRLENFKDDIKEKVGAKTIEISPADPTTKYKHQEEFSVKQEKIVVWMEKV